jgi:curved DNA-binding protein CbpA
MDISLLPYRPDRDVYRLLGVPPDAGRVEIVAACRRLARAFHPDRNGSDRATEEMQVVNAVRSLLSDPRSRAEYDRERTAFFAVPAREAAARGTPASVPARPSATPARRGSAPAVRRRARAIMSGLLTVARSLTPAHCPRCGADTEPEYRFCGSCGQRLAAAASTTMERPG